jgi:hypothetical protein
MIDFALGIGLLVVPLLLYAVFVYWFTSKNKQIDVYIQPHIFKWQVKTLLLILGTAFTLLTPGILLQTLFGSTFSGAGQFAFVSAYLIFMLSIMLFAVLVGIVIWPAVFILIMAVLSLISITSATAQMIYYGYIFLGMIPIYLSLVASSRQAGDTLILRIKEAGNFRLASRMEEESRIGILGAITGIILPQALPFRWIRRGTKKVGALKITLSISMRSHAQGTRITEKYTTVTLERMSNSPEEVRDRISKIADQITGENTNF